MELNIINWSVILGWICMVDNEWKMNDICIEYIYKMR
jgi:hypothetical protein